jgi:hypothetical protein
MRGLLLAVSKAVGAPQKLIAWCQAPHHPQLASEGIQRV